MPNECQSSNEQSYLPGRSGFEPRNVIVQGAICHLDFVIDLNFGFGHLVFSDNYEFQSPNDK
jgi:hypothetical protein